MFFVPVFLVMRVRTEVAQAHKEDGLSLNPHASEFQSVVWLYLILVWGAICGIATTAIFALEIAGVL